MCSLPIIPLGRIFSGFSCFVLSRKQTRARLRFSIAILLFFFEKGKVLGKYLSKRVLSLIPGFLLLVLVTLLLLRLAPGDVVDLILGDYAGKDEKALLRESLGLNQSFTSQFFSYIWQLLKGDFGTSLIYNKPVLSLILERFPATMKLAFFSILFSFVFGLCSGVLMVYWEGTKKEGLLSVIALLGVAIPNFWLGPLLILVFSLWFNWLPVSGYGTVEHYILPVLTMGGSLMAIVSKMTKTSLSSNLSSDYARVARAKGRSYVAVLLTHVLRNSAIPVVTIVSLQFSVLLTGAIVTESIFDWPGLGSLVLESLRNRDYPLVQGCVLFFAFSYTFISFLTDMIYLLLDPRISLQDKGSSL